MTNEYQIGDLVLYENVSTDVHSARFIGIIRRTVNTGYGILWANKGKIRTDTGPDSYIQARNLIRIGHVDTLNDDIVLRLEVLYG